MKEEEDREDINKGKIRELLENTFRQHGYSPLENFDCHIWFLEKDVQDKNSEEYFKQLLTETPKEDDDIIKFMLFNAFKKSSNNGQKLKFNVPVDSFINEIVNQIIELDNNNKSLTNLIDKYNAYEAVNTIKQNMITFHKYEERTTEITKSLFESSISSLQGMPRGDYQFSLLITQVGEDNLTQQKQYEYVLKHIIHITQEPEAPIKYAKNEFEFPSIEFFCLEQQGSPEFDSGTNLSTFQIKMVNLSKRYSEPMLSQKFKFIELLIGNSDKLMNNYEKIKTLDAKVSIKNSFYDVNIGLRVCIEFDPITLMAFFDKMNSLLKNIISFKIRVEHKYKTILSYFEGIDEKIDYILNPKEEKSDCFIF